ncbi:MAG: SufE family protein [Solitalea-like symbiont of Acarus siro]
MIDSRQETLIQEFSLFNDWADKYEYIIDQGKELELYPQEHKNDHYLIKECQSQLWLYVDSRKADNIIHFYADSDALISKGLAALILKIVNDRPCHEIKDMDFYFLKSTNLDEYITMQRSNGLQSLINKIKNYAAMCDTKLDTQENSNKQEQVIQELKTVFDPEIPVNIYDLGLIYKTLIDDQNNVKIIMTLTATGCPAVDYILQQIEEKVGAISWVKEVDIEITFDPPWDKDMMSEEAKLELAFM